MWFVYFIACNKLNIARLEPNASSNQIDDKTEKPTLVLAKLLLLLVLLPKNLPLIVVGKFYFTALF